MKFALNKDFDSIVCKIPGQEEKLELKYRGDSIYKLNKYNSNVDIGPEEIIYLTKDELKTLWIMLTKEE